MKKKEKPLTLAEAQKRIKQVNPTFTLKKVYEEYQVTFGKGRGTYFTDDLQDALDTATLNGSKEIEVDPKASDDNRNVSK